MASDTAAGDFSAGQLQVMFKELMQAVADSNPDATDIAEKLVAGVGADGAGYAQLLAAHVTLDGYDFEGAHEHLQGIAEVFEKARVTHRLKEP